MIPKIIPLDEILVEDRLREDMGNIESLVKSIEEKGLIQSLAVVELSTPDNGYNYRLLAGGRRHAACKILKMKEVPVLVLDNMNEYDMKIVELMENLQREDLTWQEELKGKKELHELQVEIHGGAKRTSDNIGWSGGDTANLIGESRTNVNRDLRLAQAIEDIPALMNVKSKHEAQKIMEKAADMVLKENLATKLNEQRAETPIDEQRQVICNNYIIKDFFEGVREVPDNSINLIEIDPPYAIDLKGLKRSRVDGAEHNSTTTAGYNEIDIGEYPVFLANTLTQSFRVMKSGGWLIFWHDTKKAEMIYTAVEKAGFKTRRISCVWNKGTGQTLHPQLHLASAYEVFLYAWKGQPILNRMGRANVFNYKPVHANKKIHPTERPIEMMEDLLNTFVPIESRVMIPYLGSGATLLAADNLGMHSFGYDLSQNFKDEFVVKVHKQIPGKFNSYGESDETRDNG